MYLFRLYVYGGYDINTGILADFHKIGLRGNAEWVDLTSDSKLYPGPRHGHSAIVYGKKMYLFGGKVSSLCSTNLLNVYDFEAEIWIMVNTSGEQPPNIDSHSAVVHEGTNLVKQTKCMYSEDSCLPRQASTLTEFMYLISTSWNGRSYLLVENAPSPARTHL